MDGYITNGREERALEKHKEITQEKADLTIDKGKKKFACQKT